MPEDSLDGDLTKTGGEEPAVAEPSSDLQRPSQRRRIERLEAGLDGLVTRLSRVEGEHQNGVDIDAAIGPLAARLDRIEARAPSEISGLAPELDELMSLRVAVAVDGRLAELAAARGCRNRQAVTPTAPANGSIASSRRWLSWRAAWVRSRDASAGVQPDVLISTSRKEGGDAQTRQSSGALQW